MTSRIKKLKIRLSRLKPLERAQALAIIGLVALVGITSLLLSRAAPVPDNSASQFILWIGADQCASLTNAQIDTWMSRGVKGFYCLETNLNGLEKPGDAGGNYGLNWTADPNNPLTDNSYRLQKSLRDGALETRVRAGDVKAYLGFYTQNSNCNTFSGPADKCSTNYGPYGYLQTPLAEWFDDNTWSNTVLPRVKDMAGAAKLLGFTGLAVDQEVYGGPATWNWNYLGNTHTEAQVRAQAKLRGQQFMQTMLSAYPGIELVGYNFQFPNTLEELAQENYGGASFANSVMINFWDGISSSEGYSALRALDWSFYKWSYPFPRDHTAAQDWATALAYSMRTMQAEVSSNFSDWNYASSRFYHTPFVWIASAAGYPAYSPDYVNQQLQAVRLWGMGGEIGLYGNDDGQNFDYSPYTADMQSFAQSSVVDSQLPNLTIDTPTSASTYTTNAASMNLAGTATDNLAIRRVAWTNDRGGSGAASMTYTDGSNWYMNWATNVPLQTGQNILTITAEDIKGLTTSFTLTINPGAGGGSTSPVISNVTSSNVTSASATITWSTNVAADSEVDYGLTANYGSMGPVDASLVTSHSVTLSGLTPHTTYYYQVKSKAAGGNQAVSTGFSLTTGSSNPPPLSALTILKTPTSPTIDGNLNEFANAPSVSFGQPQTANTAVVKALWDAGGLYLAYQVTDTHLNASTTMRDGPVWQDDAVEWFVDTLSDNCTTNPGGPCMLPDDYQGIVNLKGSLYDTRGSANGTPDVSYNGTWTAAVTTQGTLNNNSDTDTGYTVEIKIPWSSLGLSGAPADNSQLRLGLAMDDNNGVSNSYVMWPNVTSAFQNASNWQTVTLSGTSVSTPPAADTTPPTVAITTPSANTTLQASQTVTVNAADNVGVTQVQLYIDGNLVATDVASPFVFSWDTTAFSNGTHTLTAKAFDAAGNTTTSTAVPVTINNIPVSPPSQPLPGDVNGDNTVNVFDLSIMATNWGLSGATRAQGDLDGNGVVNVFDLSILATNWGQ